MLQMCTLLDTMSTETGERNAQAAHRTALETVIEDTEAELAKLQRSKVASMIRLYQGEPSAPTPAFPHLCPLASTLLPRSVCHTVKKVIVWVWRVPLARVSHLDFDWL